MAPIIFAYAYVVFGQDSALNSHTTPSPDSYECDVLYIYYLFVYVFVQLFACYQCFRSFPMKYHGIFPLQYRHDEVLQCLYCQQTSFLISTSNLGE